MTPERRRGPEPRALGEPVAVNHGLQLTIFALLFGIAIPLMAIQELIVAGADARLALVGAALLAGPPGWFALAEARFRIVVSPRGLEARSVFGERRSLPWGSIHEVRFGPISRSLVFVGRDGDRSVHLRVSLLRREVEPLGRAVPHYLPVSVWSEAWEAMFGARR